ncbi:hypothetical protein Mgra_00002958, partial [Meloidogyne graminicola]
TINSIKYIDTEISKTTESTTTLIQTTKKSSNKTFLFIIIIFLILVIIATIIGFYFIKLKDKGDNSIEEGKQKNENKLKN